MGEIYLAVPLNNELAEALSQSEISHPSFRDPSKSVTPNLVYRVISQINDCDYTVLDSNNAECVEIDLRQSPESWTQINLSNFSNFDAPCNLSFHRGDVELVRKVVSEIAKHCGPYVIWSGSGEIVEVIL